VVTHSCTGNSFYTYLVTAQGIQGPFTQQIGFNLVLPISGFGQTWFSLDGSKFVTTSNTDINLFDFDRCTGLFSNWTFLAKPDTNNAGCVLSSNSRLLYYSEGYHIYQYDLSVANWQSTETLVATYDSFLGPCNTLFYKWALMSNGKIYGIPANCGSQYLHVINSPDSSSTTCNVQQHSVFLPTYNAGTIPNYPNYRLGKLDGSVCDTLTGSPPAPQRGDLALLYPNPTSNSVTVKVQQDELLKNVSLYNLIGEKVMEQDVSSFVSELNINVAALLKGIYLVKVKTNKGVVYKKLVKQ
jgi:hypothetical protein